MRFDQYGLPIYPMGKPQVERVIFNDPATIVFWNDGTKTVVKCMEGDTYSKEVGLAMCISKKMLGDKFHWTFTKWVFKDKGFKYRVGDRVKFTTSISGVREGVIEEIKPGEGPLPYVVRTDGGSRYYLADHMNKDGVGKQYVILCKVKKEGK